MNPISLAPRQGSSCDAADASAALKWPREPLKGKGFCPLRDP
jgi:hypothetical protein